MGNKQKKKWDIKNLWKIGKQNIVYHGSSKAGLTKLEPFECRHGKPYVYATNDYITVLFFASKGQGMFDGWITDGMHGVPIYYEAYPNALKNRYWGKRSFCYLLPADKFTNATGDPCEVVSEESVDIIGCEEIRDIGLEFEKLEKQGKIKFVWYNESSENSKEACEKRALQLLIDRGYFEGKDFRQKEWASKYYKDLIENYKKSKRI